MSKYKNNKVNNKNTFFVICVESIKSNYKLFNKIIRKFSVCDYINTFQLVPYSTILISGCVKKIKWGFDDT